MIKLYGYSRSRWVKPYWTLKELGVPFEPISIRPDKITTDHPEFLRINPFGKVPAIEDGDFTLFEASAICTYLADKFSDKGLIPNVGTRDRARLEQFMSLCITDLEQPLWRIAKNTFLYPEEKRSKHDIEMATADFLKMAAALEDHISDYLVGEKFSIADIAMTYTLNWANGYKFLETFPRLQAYAAKHTARSAYPRELYVKS